MRANCKAAVEQAINRPLAPGETEFIENQILAQLRANAKDRPSWRALTPAQRITRAGELAARELALDSEIPGGEWNDSDLRLLQEQIEIEANKAGIPLVASIDEELDEQGVSALYGATRIGRRKEIVRILSVAASMTEGANSVRNALRNMQGLLTHEFVHWAKEGGVWSAAEWDSLVEAATRLPMTKAQADALGNDSISFWREARGEKKTPPTYLQYATAVYGDPDINQEEAVAIMLEIQRLEALEDDPIPGEPGIRRALGSLIKVVRAIARAVKSLTKPKQEALRRYAAAQGQALRSGELVKQSLKPFETSLGSFTPTSEISDHVASKYGDYIPSLIDAIRKGDVASIITHPIWTQYEMAHKGSPTVGTANPVTFVKSPRFKAKRYLNGRGEKVTGPEVIESLVKKAKTYGSNKKRNRGIAHESRAIIVTGSPGSGKTTIGRDLAAKSRAALVQTDDILPRIPEYRNGDGYYDVITEAEHLAGLVVNELSYEEGPDGDIANIVVEQMGNEPAALSALIANLSEAGYKIDVVHIEANFGERVVNIANRFLRTGRWVRASDQIDVIGNMPTANHGFVEEKAQNEEIQSATRIRYSRGGYKLVRKIGQASPGTARTIRAKAGRGSSKPAAQALSRAKQFASEQILENIADLVGIRGNVNQLSMAARVERLGPNLIETAVNYEGKDPAEALDWLATEEVVYRAATQGNEDLFPLISNTQRPNLSGSIEERARAYTSAYMSFEERMARAKAAGYDVPAYRALTRPYAKDERGGVEFYALNQDLSNTYVDGKEGGNIVPAFLKTGKRLLVKAGGNDWDRIPISSLPGNVIAATNEAISAYEADGGKPSLIPGVFNTNQIAYGAKALGYDSVVFQNVKDSMAEDRPPETVYAILSKTNAVSAFNAFGPDFDIGDFSRSIGSPSQAKGAAKTESKGPATRLPPASYRTTKQFSNFWKLVGKYPALKNAAFNAGANLSNRNNGNYVSEQQLHAIVSTANSMQMESKEWQADLAAIEAYASSARNGGAEPSGNFAMQENLRTGKLALVVASDGRAILINPQQAAINHILRLPDAGGSVITVKDSDGNIYVAIKAKELAESETQYDALVRELRTQGIPVNGYSYGKSNSTSVGEFSDTANERFKDTFHYIYPRRSRPEADYIDAISKVFGSDNVRQALKTGRLNIVSSFEDLKLADGDFALEYFVNRYGSIRSRKDLRGSMPDRRHEMTDDAGADRTYYGFTGYGGNAMAVEFIENRGVAVVNFGGLDMRQAKIDTDLRGKGSAKQINSLENLTETLGTVVSAMEDYIKFSKSAKLLVFQPASDAHQSLYSALFRKIESGQIEIPAGWQTQKAGFLFALSKKNLTLKQQYELSEEAHYPSAFIFPGRESAEQREETLSIFREIGIRWDMDPGGDPDLAVKAAEDGALNTTGSPVGFSTKDGKVYLFTDTATPDDAVAVLFHELGHVAFEEIPNFKEIMTSFQKLVDAKDPDAIRGFETAKQNEPAAYERSLKGDKKAQSKIWREALAYALQGVKMESLQPSWWNTLMELYHGFRLWLGKKFPETLENLTFNNLKYMALGVGKIGLRAEPGVLRRENYFGPVPLGNVSMRGEFSWSGKNFILDNGTTRITGRLWRNNITGEDTLKIDISGTDPDARKIGSGSALYAQLAEEAEKRGIPLVSDRSVSEAAARRYQWLKTYGYDVQQNPNATLVKGVWGWQDGNPIFVVRGRIQSDATQSDAQANFAKGEAPRFIVKDTFQHPTLGKIELPEGNKKFGWEHIVAKHGNDLPDFSNIASWREVRRTPDNRYIDISDGNNYATIATDYAGEKRTWIVTGWSGDGGLSRGDFARAPLGATPPGTTPPPPGGTAAPAAATPAKRWKYGNLADAAYKARRAADEVANLNRKTFSPFFGMWAEQIPNYRPLRRHISDAMDGFDKDLQEWNRAKLAKIVNLMPGIRDIVKNYLPFGGIPDALIQNVIQAYATGDSQQAQDKAKEAANAIDKALDKESSRLAKINKNMNKEEIRANLNIEAYEAMIEADPVLQMQKIAALPGDLQDAVLLSRRMISEVSDALLNAGLISMETYEKNFGHYLRRAFTKYIDTYRPGAGFRASGAYYTKQKQQLSGDTKITMGEIKDLPMLVYMSIQQPLHDITVYDYWNAIMHHSNNSTTSPKWALPKSLVKWNGKTVSLWWLANEEFPQIEKMIRTKKSDLRAMVNGGTAPSSSYAATLSRELGVLLRDRTRIQKLIRANPDYATAMSKELLPRGYRQLPTKPAQLGSAAGAVVMRDFYNQSQPGLFEAAENRDDAFGYIMRLVNGANRNFKFLLTVANPVSHFRNLYSNTIILPKNGINAMHLLPAATQLSDYYRKGTVTPLVKALQETGLLGAAWTEQELRVMDVFVSKVKRQSDRAKAAESIKGVVSAIAGGPIGPKAAGVVDGALEAANLGRLLIEAVQDTYGRKASDLYQGADVLFKAAVMHDRLSRGVPPGVASLEATRLFFDLSRVVPFVRTMRDAPLGNTFISYNYFALPVALDGYLTAPWRKLYTPSALSFGLFGYFLLTAMLGYDDDDLRQLFSASAGKNNHGLVGIPMRDEHGRPGLYDAGAILPEFMFLNALTQLGSPGGVLSALSTLGFGGVMGNMGVGYVSGVDPRFGMRIWEEFDPPEVREAKRNAWLIRQMIPSTYSAWTPPFGPNDTGGANYEAVFGTGLDRRGMPTMTEGDVALRNLGFNVRRVDAFYEYSKRMREYNWRLSEIERAINRIQEDQRLTPERRQQAIDRRLQEAQDIREERTEFQQRVAEVMTAEEQNLAEQ